MPIRGLEGLVATVKAKAWPVEIGMDLMVSLEKKTREHPLWGLPTGLKERLLGRESLDVDDGVGLCHEIGCL